jgi:hypothetical protein
LKRGSVWMIISVSPHQVFQLNRLSESESAER